MQNMKGLLPKRSERTKEWPSVFICRASPSLTHPSWCKRREGGTGKAAPCLHVSLTQDAYTIVFSWVNESCMPNTCWHFHSKDSTSNYWALETDLSRGIVELYRFIENSNVHLNRTRRKWWGRKGDAGHVSGKSGIVDMGVTWPWEQMSQALCFLVHKIKMD